LDVARQGAHCAPAIGVSFRQRADKWVTANNRGLFFALIARTFRNTPILNERYYYGQEPDQVRAEMNWHTHFAQFKTRHGIWSIQQIRGRFHAFFEDEDLGSYHAPHSALDDLVGGHTFWPSSGIDPEECSISDDIGKWELMLVGTAP